MSSKGKHAKNDGTPDWGRFLGAVQTAALLADAVARWVVPLIQHGR